jgi:hypothetical protein
MRNRKATTTITISKKRLSAKQIVAAACDMTYSGCYVARVNGLEIDFSFRTSYNPDGTRQSFGRHTICDPGNADMIDLESHGVRLHFDPDEQKWSDGWRFVKSSEGRG